MSLLLNFSQAAEQIGCTEKTLRRAVIRGDLTVVRLGTSSRSDKIHPDDLIAYIDRLRQRGQTLCQSNQKTQSKRGATCSTSISNSKAEQLDKLLDVKWAKKN